MPADYSYGDYLVRVDEGVVEQFQRSIVGSYRVPIAWACAQVAQRKHDVTRITIGVTADPAVSFFSTVAYSSGSFVIDLPDDEALRLREFLSAAAENAGRVV